MRLPDFLIIGAQKSGTTWLAEQLRTHPRIFMPPGELHFFDQTEPPDRDVSWYADQFRTAGDRLAGEKTPNYLFLPDNPDIHEGHLRLAELLPDARLIAVLRDPVERAVSAVRHMLREGVVSPVHSIDALLGPKRDLLSWHVLEVGRYAGQIAAFLDLYGPDRLLVLYYEDDIVAAPAAMVERMCRFLGLEPATDPGRLGLRANSARPSRLRLVANYYAPVLRPWTHHLDRVRPPYYPSPSAATRRWLSEYYEPHNERLFALLGRRPCSGWRYAPETEEAL